jgi:hypothetical protein
VRTPLQGFKLAVKTSFSLLNSGFATGLSCHTERDVSFCCIYRTQEQVYPAVLPIFTLPLALATTQAETSLRTHWNEKTELCRGWCSTQIHPPQASVVRSSVGVTQIGVRVSLCGRCSRLSELRCCEGSCFLKMPEDLIQ